MGLSGISPLSLLLILAIVALLFGTNRIRRLGQDIGEMLKGFREGMEPKSTTTPPPLDQKDPTSPSKEDK